MGRRPSQKPLARSEMVAEIEELRAVLGLTVPAMAARLGLTRQSLWAVLYGINPPGPKVELGVRLLREQLKEDAARLREKADELAALSR